MKVRSLVWTPDDRSLFSCGSDGAIYEWNTYDGTRANDVITKQCDYMGLATSQDGKLVYGVGSDGLLKEINNAEVYISGHQLYIHINYYVKE